MNVIAFLLLSALGDPILIQVILIFLSTEQHSELCVTNNDVLICAPRFLIKLNTKLNLSSDSSLPSQIIAKMFLRISSKDVNKYCSAHAHFKENYERLLHFRVAP